MSDAPRPASVRIFESAPTLPGSAPVADARALQDAVADAFDYDGGSFDDAPPPEPPSVDVGDLATLAACAGLEQNDTDNGARLLAHFGEELLHVREIGWHQWDGRIWRRQGGDEAATVYAQRTAKRIHAEVPLLEHLPHETRIIAAAEPLRGRKTADLSKEERDAVEAADDAIGALKGRRRSLHKHATTSGNSGRITAMIAQALPHKSVATDAIDADPMLFNVENCTLRFSKIEDPDNPGDERPNWCLKVEERPHDRADRLTKMAPVIYDPTATCPRFEAFMAKFQPDPSPREYLQTFHGLALTGLSEHQCFLFNYGSGANGKSTMMEALAQLFGGYADVLNPESVSGQGQRRGDQATPDFAELPGKRYLRVSELPRGEGLKENLIKALTGGEPIKVRHLNKGFFDLIPVFKAVMSGNDKPRIGGVDNGIWRRVKLVVWPVALTEAERRPMAEVLAEFAEERSGILNWLIAGLDRYMREGLITPQSVVDDTAEYRNEMDPVGSFIRDCIVTAPGHDVTARDAYIGFVRYCEGNSIKPWQETMFGRVMPQKGIERENGRVRKYKNITLVLDGLPAAPRSPGSGGDGGQ